jgi:hypothetical protein
MVRNKDARGLVVLEFRSGTGDSETERGYVGTKSSREDGTQNKHLARRARETLEGAGRAVWFLFLRLSRATLELMFMHLWHMDPYNHVTVRGMRWWRP